MSCSSCGSMGSDGALPGRVCVRKNEIEMAIATMAHAMAPTEQIHPPSADTPRDDPGHLPPKRGCGGCESEPMGLTRDLSSIQGSGWGGDLEVNFVVNLLSRRWCVGWEPEWMFPMVEGLSIPSSRRGKVRERRTVGTCGRLVRGTREAMERDPRSTPDPARSPLPRSMGK